MFQMRRLNSGSIVRILYVHRDIDEKDSSTQLEEVIERYVRNPSFSFTCVTSSLMAVECVKTTEFSLLMVEKQLTDLSGEELVNILAANCCVMPVVYLIKREELNSPETAQLEQRGYFILADPFSPAELCSTMFRVFAAQQILLQYHHHPEVFGALNAAPTIASVSSFGSSHSSGTEDLESPHRKRVKSNEVTDLQSNGIASGSYQQFSNTIFEDADFPVNHEDM